MRIILLTFLLLSNISYSQNAIRLFFQRPNDFYKQTIIAFTDSSTDGLDQCCDAILLGGSSVGIWTSIGNNRYAINSFGILNEDKIIPIGLQSYTNEGQFVIGVDWQTGPPIEYRLMDAEYPGEFFVLPYVFSGSIYEGRFSLYIDRPMTVGVFPGCEVGKVSITNDDDETPYMLYQSGELIGEIPSYVDTLFDISDGNYELIGGQFDEIHSFYLENTQINANLYVSSQNVWINDAYIEGIVTIFTPYTSISWDFGDGSPMVTDDTNPVHLYQNTGTYILKVIIRRGQCEKILQSLITVESLSGFNTPMNPIRLRTQVQRWDLAGRRLR